MPQRFNCDDERTRTYLRKRYRGGAFPRKTAYGRAPDLIPYGEAYPDRLVDPRDYREQIKACHAALMFPIYHQHASWAPPGFQWNQNGLPYCWAWGVTSG